MLSVSDIRAEVTSALSGRSPIALANAHHLPRNAIWQFLRGHEPKAERLISICSAVGLELYVGPPREEAGVRLPASTDSHVWGDRKGKVITPYPVPVREGHAPVHVGISPNGCAHFGLEFLMEFDLDPAACQVVEFRDDSMAPEFPAGAAGIVDLRRKDPIDGGVYAIGISDLIVRRVYSSRHGWRLVPDNRDFRVLTWTEDLDIAGQIVWTSHMVDVEAAA